MSNNRNGLGIIEYVSVAGSVLGSAIAVITQQMIYGLAPVSLSLLLNLINRRRLEQLCQQSSSDSTQLQQLRSAIDSVSAANAKLEQDVQNLVPIQQLTSVVSSVEQLSQQHNGLRLSLVPLQSRLDDLIEQFNKRPELEQIESLTAVITALKQCIDNLPQPEQLEHHSAKFQQQVELALVQLSEKTTQLSQNSQRVERLEDAIAQLQQQLSERY
jgi:chromosome segregation ATPase